ncbi:MAG: 30S ribosomal protein S20 [Candidatus Babeliales bacterium]
MANTRSAQKKVRQDEKRRVVNHSRLSMIKTSVKKLLLALENGASKDEALTMLRHVEASLARAKGKGVIHRNTARRKTSKLAKKVAQVYRTDNNKKV